VELVATYLLAHTGSGYSIAAATFGCAVGTLIAVALMRDHSRSDIDDDASYGAPVPVTVRAPVEEHSLR
jgi:hypothetical protein